MHRILVLCLVLSLAAAISVHDAVRRGRAAIAHTTRNPPQTPKEMRAARQRVYERTIEAIDALEAYMDGLYSSDIPDRDADRLRTAEQDRFRATRERLYGVSDADGRATG